MKNLFPILALLLLVGCTSEPTPPTELERCIEANYTDLTRHPTQEEFVAPKLKSHLDFFENRFKGDFWISPEVEALTEGANKIYRECEARKEAFNQDPDSTWIEEEDCIELSDLSKENKEKELMWKNHKKELVPALEEESSFWSLNFIEQYQASLKEYYSPEKIKEREKVAEKICNSQGIY